MLFLSQLEQSGCPSDGFQMQWPGDDRIWTYYAAEGKFVPGPRADDGFDGGDIWEDDDPDDDDPNPSRPLPWIL